MSAKDRVKSQRERIVEKIERDTDFLLYTLLKLLESDEYILLSTDSGSYTGGGLPLNHQSPTPITLDLSLPAPTSPPGISNVPNVGSFSSSTYSHHHPPSVNSIFSQQQQQHGHQVVQIYAHFLTQADMSHLINDHAQGMQPRPPPVMSRAPMVATK